MIYRQVSKSGKTVHQKRSQPQRRPEEQTQAPLHPLVQLQQTIGNRAVAHFIQPKLRISQPRDMYEQEADQVAVQVNRMPELQIANGEAVAGEAISRRIQRLCPECEDELRPQREKKKEEEIGPKSLADQIRPSLQEQLDEEKEEELVQAKFISPDIQEVQRQEEAEEEEESIKTRIESGHTSEVTPAIASHISVSRSTALQAKEKGENRDDEVKIKRKPVITFPIVRSDQPPPIGVVGKRQACPVAAPAAQRHRHLDATAAQIAGMGACTWGITMPDNLGISTETCRDGANWRLIVTRVNSVIRTHSRLLAGQAEPVPGVNTTAGNFCDQVTELDTLGVCPGAWYMIRAVHAHENVHIDEWRNNFTADWTPLQTAIEALTVPAAGATANRAAATAALRGTAVFVNAGDASNAGANFPTFWGIPDPNANTNAAETAVVTPRLRWICQHAGWQGWAPAGCPVCVAQGIA